MRTCARYRSWPDSPRWDAARHLPTCRALSLLETTIAIGILGVGLIMVAAIFPVALAQHRDNADQMRALAMTSRAEAMLHNRLDATSLWFDPNLFDLGIDSPWLLLPFSNINVGGGFVDLTNYTAQINGRTTLPSVSEVQLFGTDVMSDRRMPIDDNNANDVPNRLIWNGFYRQLANGTKSFAVAVCKQRRNQFYYMQDLTIATPALNPTASMNLRLRLPVPWRVSVSRLPGSQILFNDTTATIGLAQLAPKGSKIMIHGAFFSDLGPVPPVPPGRILTVIDTAGNNEIQILEPVGDLVANDPTDAGDGNVTFDVWLFPPAAVGRGFAKSSPLIEWKVSL